MRLFTRRKFWIGGTTSERPKFESFALCIVRSCVKVGFAEDDHPNVGVEIDLACLGTGKPKVNQVSEPLSGVWMPVTLITRHVESSLTKEGLR